MTTRIKRLAALLPLVVMVPGLYLYVGKQIISRRFKKGWLA
jgi:hypothetical protein